MRLALERTFGRWQLTREGFPVPTAELLDLLVARMELRRVEVRLNEPVRVLRPGLVETDPGQMPVKAIVAAVNPWEYLRLTDQRDRALRWRTMWTRPALAPAVEVTERLATSASLHFVEGTETLTGSVLRRGGARGRRGAGGLPTA